jgi:hypothetical protein
MRITSSLFDAFLKSSTKGHLRSLGEIGSGNDYAEWVRGQDESYQREVVRGLQETVPEAERVVAPPATESLKAAKWRLAVDLVAQTPDSAASEERESRANEDTNGPADRAPTNCWSPVFTPPSACRPKAEASRPNSFPSISSSATSSPRKTGTEDRKHSRLSGRRGPARPQILLSDLL